LFDEMRAFRRSEPGISPDKILEMVTVNPAAALHQENALGRIRRGFRADLIAVRCNEVGAPFEQILECDSSVDWRMVNGKQ
jgi:imidazolonepropionase-like amidohydrolase